MRPLVAIYFALSVTLLSCGSRHEKNEAAPTPPKEAPAEDRTLACKAYYQAGGAGTEVETQELSLVKQTEKELTYEAKLHDIAYKVAWTKPLTALYMEISSNNGKASAFSTSRVPSHDHNDAMLDFSPTGAPRYYVSCDIVEFRPSN